MLPSCKRLVQIIAKHPTFLNTPQCPSLRFICNFSGSPDEASLTLSYLINSCGLSPESALSASKDICLNTTERADSVLEFFKTHGFSSAQIARLISVRPQSLLADVDKTLKPKIEYFHDLGLSDSEIATFVSTNPGILWRGLRTQIIPSVDFLRNMVHSNENVIKAFRRCRWMFTCNLQKRMQPNIAILKDYGVPDSLISRMVLIEPRILSVSTGLLREVSKKVDELGFERGSGMFVIAIKVMCSMKTSMWVAKIELFKSLGWSEDVVFDAFRRMPVFMTCSEQKARAVMEFFVKNLRWKPCDVARNPILLKYSLKGRLIPRTKVWKILKYKELVDDGDVSNMLKLSESDFLRRYVSKYEKEIPYLLKAYKGELDYRWLNCKSRGAGGEDAGNIRKPSL